MTTGTPTPRVKNATIIRAVYIGISQSRSSTFVRVARRTDLLSEPSH
jgi:hypothetical protein